MERGLIYLSTGAPRQAREEYQILRDEWSYAMVKAYAPPADMQEIDGWARSFYTMEGHIQSIMAYDKTLLPESSDTIWHSTKEEVLKEFQQFEKVTSLTFENGFDQVRYESSSMAGYGYTGRKGEHQNFAKAKRIANAAVRGYAESIQLSGKTHADDDITANSAPDFGLTRTQLSQLPSIKVRNVFGEAFHYILIEGLSAYPLLEVFKRRDTFYFIGKDPVYAIPQLLESLEHRTSWYSVVDWSNFDASVQNWEIDHAFNCLRQTLIFPSQLSQLSFEYAFTVFKKRKLFSPDGRMFMRTSGIPSGSYFTNLIGSIINYTRIKFIMSKLGYPVERIVTQGDDSLTFIGPSITPDPREFSQISDPYGWKVKPEKCIITNTPDDVTFLGRSSRHRYNIRDRLKALRLICFPEFKIDNPSISTARVHAIQRDAGFTDPIFDIVYSSLYNMYGEAQSVPNNLLPFFERDWYL